MKLWQIALALSTALACASPAIAKPKAVSVKAHTRSDGTYVPAHMRTAPNDTRNDNWSTMGNHNPYTGERGTRPRGADGMVAQAGYGTPAC